MAKTPLHCQHCGRTFTPRWPPGDAELLCAACGGPLAEAPPAQAPPPDRDIFRGRTVGGAVLKKRLALRPGHALYRGRHTGLKVNARARVFPAESADQDIVHVERLFRRVAALRDIRNLHVVALLDIGRLADCYFIVTEDVPASLQAVLDGGAPLRVAKALPILEGALRGLAALERAGICHGDLRPEAVLLDYDGAARLDIPGPPSLAALNGLFLTDAGTVTGPALYLAPERALDERRADIRSDLYALGAILYHMLTGRPPFEAATAQQVMRRHVESPTPDPRQVRPRLPGPVCEFTARLMAKDPDGRPAGPEAALEELFECVQALRAARQWRGPVPGEAPKSDLRRRAGWALAATLLIVAAAVPFVLLHRHKKQEKPVAPPHHRTMLLLQSERLAPDVLPDREAAAIKALLDYRLSFLPELDPADLDSVERLLGATGNLERARQEMGATDILAVSHGQGLGRRNWGFIFVHHGKEGWSVHKKASVPHGEGDWSAIEEAVRDLLAEAARRLEVEPADGSDVLLGVDAGAWAALAEALAAEREDRWSDALAALDGAAPDRPPLALLRALCAAVNGARTTGSFGPVADLPRDGLPPEMAALADTLAAVGAGDLAVAQESFGSYLARFPGSARGYHLLGLWRLHAQDSAGEGLLAFRHAARLDPGYLPAAHACVDLLRQHRPDDLEAFLEEFEEAAADGETARAVRRRAEEPGAQ